MAALPYGLDTWISHYHLNAQKYAELIIESGAVRIGWSRRCENRRVTECGHADAMTRSWPAVLHRDMVRAGGSAQVPFRA